MGLGIKEFFKSKVGGKKKKAPEAPKKYAESDKKQAVLALKNLKKEVNEGISKEEYNRIQEQKSRLLSQAGNEAGARAALVELEDVLKPIGDKFDRQEEEQRTQQRIKRREQQRQKSREEWEQQQKQQQEEEEQRAQRNKAEKEEWEREQKRKREQEARQKTDKHINIIVEESNTPLETLIKKNLQLGQDSTVVPPEVSENHAWNANSSTKSVGECIKEKLYSLPSTIKGSVKEAFSGWSNALETAYSLLTGSLDTAGDSSGIGADSDDIQKINDVISGIHEADDSGGGVTAAVLGGLSTVLKCIKTGVNIVQMIRKKHLDSNGKKEVVLNRQGKWKRTKGLMRDIVEIIGGFQGAFGPLSKMIPLFNNIAGICVNAATMMLDIMDVADHSIHIELMRRERKRIYERIQEKKAKYLSDESKDADAAKAYEIGKKHSSKAIDKKRRELMTELGTRNSRITLRSRNDSQYREIQYELGKNIQEAEKKIVEARAEVIDDTLDTTEKEKREKIRNEKIAAAKSKKRQLEAFELMEQYREIDKSHNKMSKALAHNLEDIIIGGAGIVSNGLNLAGEILAVSGVGAGAGAGLLTGGLAVGIAKSGYSVGRDVTSKGYKAVRSLIGSEDNKSTTREDMAISLINRMTEVGESDIWDKSYGKFKEFGALEQLDRKMVIRQARNVEHLHNVFKRGLDADMPDMIDAANKKELKEKIMAAFGQE